MGGFKTITKACITKTNGAFLKFEVGKEEIRAIDVDMIGINIIRAKWTKTIPWTSIDEVDTCYNMVNERLIHD